MATRRKTWLFLLCTLSLSALAVAGARTTMGVPAPTPAVVRLLALEELTSTSALVGSASASEVSTSGSEGSDRVAVDLPGWLMQAITSLGIAGGPVMFFFWFLEYRQRIKWQDDLLDRNEKFINSANEMANALTAVTASVAGAQEAIRATTALLSDMAGTLRLLSKRSTRE